MAITAKLLCLFVALLLFAVAALGIGGGRFNLVAAGLAFFTLAEIVS